MNNQADLFAMGVVARYNVRAASDVVRHERLYASGAEIALILAILQAVVAGCDLLNPGWRDWLRRLLPWSRRPRIDARRIKLRARRVLDHSDQRLVGRVEARRDRAALIEIVRRVAFSNGSQVLVSPEILAEAICANVGLCSDRELVTAIEGLRGS